MLKLTVVMGEDSWDEVTQEFVPSDDTVVLHLEHSLASLSKWESEFEKPFLGDVEKTREEVVAYIRFMILDDDFPPGVFSRFTEKNMESINSYINAKSTATWFSETGSRRSREVITSELIYYWMVSFSIPFECQHWHLNRLFTLIRVCNEKNQKPKPTNRATDAAQRRELNERRRRQLNSSG